jgi:hypothetical protein
MNVNIDDFCSALYIFKSKNVNAYLCNILRSFVFLLIINGMTKKHKVMFVIWAETEGGVELFFLHSTLIKKQC